MGRFLTSGVDQPGGPLGGEARCYKHLHSGGGVEGNRVHLPLGLQHFISDAWCNRIGDLGARLNPGYLAASGEH